MKTIAGHITANHSYQSTHISLEPTFIEMAEALFYPTPPALHNVIISIIRDKKTAISYKKIAISSNNKKCP